MPDPPDPGRVRAILLDIEGTTTPVDFVTRVLFPYARERVREFLTRRGAELAVRGDLAGLRAEHDADDRAGAAPPPWRDGTPAEALHSAVAYVHWLMDRDRKSTALKALQGRIWVITRESKRLSDTLNHFLYQARPALPLSGPVDIGRAVEEAVTLLRNGPEVRAGHSVEFETDEGPHVCLAGPDQIKQGCASVTDRIPRQHYCPSRG